MVFVASDPFLVAATAQSEALGFAAPFVLTEHPIQDRTNDEMINIADKTVDEIIKALTA